MQRLVLYSRHACHLCEVMQAELLALLGDRVVKLEIRDVDEKIEWRERYGLRVPVLATESGEVLSEYQLEETRLTAWLQALS